MTDDQQPGEQGTEAAPEAEDTDYFAELTDVRESIVDGVVTCW